MRWPAPSTKDLTTEPLGTGKDGKPVYPEGHLALAARGGGAGAQVRHARRSFKAKYADVFKGDANWRKIKVTGGLTYAWENASTYVQNPPYFTGMAREPKPVTDIESARVLGLFVDSITTDHISPAGSIKAASPAGKYLHRQRRRGDRLQPVRHAPRQSRGDDARHLRQHPHQERDAGRQGGRPHHPLSGRRGAADLSTPRCATRREGVPLVVFAGKEYGTGSSRDWAAKGTNLLGVRAVIAQSFERIHRSNLVGMGVLPLVFFEGTSWQSLGLKGDETVTIKGLEKGLKPRQTLTAAITRGDGSTFDVPLQCRIDTEDELEYFKNGGILHYVLRGLAA